MPSWSYFKNHSQSCVSPQNPNRAVNDVSRNPASLGLWQTIISKLNPTFLTLCQQADELSKNLADYILSKKDYSDEVKERIKGVFVNNDDSKVHSRHIDIQRCKDVGLNIEDLEDDPEMQDMVLSIHHCCMILGEASNIVKVVENNIGGEFSYHLPPQQPRTPGPLMQFQIDEP